MIFQIHTTTSEEKIDVAEFFDALNFVTGRLLNGNMTYPYVTVYTLEDRLSAYRDSLDHLVCITYDEFKAAQRAARAIVYTIHVTPYYVTPAGRAIWTS